MYSAQEVVEAFNRINGKLTWSAKVNSRETEDLAIFYSPSDLIELSYDAITGNFLVRFAKASAPFRSYVIAIAKALTYILECLSDAGLDFTPPKSFHDCEVVSLVGNDKDVIVRCPAPAQTGE